MSMYCLARNMRTNKIVIVHEAHINNADLEVIERYPNYKTAEAKLKSMTKPKKASHRKQEQIDNLLNVYQFLGSSKER